MALGSRYESSDENDGFGQHDVGALCPVGSAMGILGDGPKVIKATLNADGSVTVEHDGAGGKTEYEDYVEFRADNESFDAKAEREEQEAEDNVPSDEEGVM